MSRTSILLLPSTQEFESVVGEPVRVDAGRGLGRRLHTVAVYTSNFQGTLHIEASLVAEPTDADWFAAVEPMVFPDFPTEFGGETSARGFSFKGNYVWLRARMERDDIDIVGNGPISAAYGFIDRVLLNN